MSTFADRPNRALLVIDVQEGVVWDAHDRATVVTNIATLVDDARTREIPVVWVQHHEVEMPIGSDYWQLVPELVPRADEPRVNKEFRSSFEQTDLEDVLADLGVGSLIVCGAQTNYCVRHTSHAALERGYDVTLVADAHTTSDLDGPFGGVPATHIIAEQNASMLEYDLPGRRATVAAAATALD